jgi:uncharacterized protein
MRDWTIGEWDASWRPKIEAWVADALLHADSGHGLDHIQRVVNNAKLIGESEQADPKIVLPAAWLHDCVSVPKNSPDRSRASTLAADRAVEFLHAIEYPGEAIDSIHHCIQAHSFSAGLACQTLEAMVVQDADRLEALGAIGLSRCLMTGGAMRQRLYDPNEPFPLNRKAEDSLQSTDHFFAKLLGLGATMKTKAGRHEASSRTDFLLLFLRQLAKELGHERSLQLSLDRLGIQASDLS